MSTNVEKTVTNQVGTGTKKIPIVNKVAFLDKKIPNMVAFIGIFSIFIVWELVCQLGWVNELTLPAPSTILSNAWELFVGGLLWADIYASMYRLSLGYLIGCFIGITTGLLLGFSKVVEKIGLPIVNFLYPIPKIAILPLIMLWLGIGEISKVTVVALAVFFPVVFNTYSGVAQTPRLLINASVVFGASKFEIIRKVILPSAVPFILSGMRIAAGTSLLILVAAEMIAAQHGIGSFVLHNADLLNIPRVMVGVFILSILGLTFSRSLFWLEKKLIPWR